MVKKVKGEILAFKVLNANLFLIQFCFKISIMCLVLVYDIYKNNKKTI